MTGPSVLGREEYLARWSSLHGGAATTGLVGAWLSLVHRLAVPAARRGLGPDAVTLAGAALACCAPLPALAGGRWCLLAAVVVGLSGLLDNLDGALAVVTGRERPLGMVLDSVCDRVAEVGHVLALWAAGAPGALVAAAGAVGWLQEYLRARAGVAGMDTVGVVSVAERPTRVLGCGMFLLAQGLFPGTALPGGAAWWPTAGAAVLVATGAVGLVQVAVAVRSGLR